MTLPNRVLRFWKFQLSGRAWRRATWVVLACMAVFVPASIQAEPISPERVAGEGANQYPEVKEAVAKFNAGEYQQAEEQLRIAVARHPELSPAQVMLARLFMTVNALPASRAALEKAVALKPNDPEAYEMLGNLALAERRMTEAGMLFDKALELTAKMEGESKRKKDVSVRAISGKASVAESRQHWDDAAKDLQEWIKLDPKNFRPHFRLGQVLFYQKKPDEAYAELKAAGKLSDQSPNAEVFMGRLYRQAGDDPENRAKSEHWMKLAMETSPKDPAMHIGVAEWYWEKGDLDEAKKHADEALKLKPDSLDAKVIRGLVARFQHDLPEAENQLEGAYLAAPTNFTASNQLALVLAESGDEAKVRRAVELAELNAKQQPNNPEAAATLGWVYFKSARFDEAARALQAVVSSGTVTGDSAYYVAELFAQRNQLNEATKFLRAALDAKGPFANRAAAQALYDQLNKKS